MAKLLKCIRCQDKSMGGVKRGENIHRHHNVQTDQNFVFCVCVRACLCACVRACVLWGGCAQHTFFA